MINAESPDHIIKRHYIIFCNAPAHQGYPIQNALRRVTQILQITNENGMTIFDGFSSRAFAHLTLATWLKEHGEMHPNRFIPIKGAQNIDVQGEGGEPFGTTDHMRDVH